jgi:hypothetical protein
MLSNRKLQSGCWHFCFALGRSPVQNSSRWPLFIQVTVICFSLAKTKSLRLLFGSFPIRYLHLTVSMALITFIVANVAETWNNKRLTFHRISLQNWQYRPNTCWSGSPTLEFQPGSGLYPKILCDFTQTLRKHRSTTASFHILSYYVLR